MSVPGREEVLAQSEAAVAQYHRMWLANASHNRRHNKRSQKELINIGKGKSAECFAYGPSLLQNIEDFKKLPESEKGDIICCDKAFHALILNGLKPKYVVVADAKVDGSKYLMPYTKETKDIALIACVTCSTEWTDNWQGPIYFYANKDNLNSHEHYGTAAGCNELILAGSNVSNSLVILLILTLSGAKQLEAENLNSYTSKLFSLTTEKRSNFFELHDTNI